MRKILLLLTVIIVGLLFISRLFYLQVYKKEAYSLFEDSAIKKEYNYPKRGYVYDRNDKLLADLTATLSGNTRLCIACDITLTTEYIRTMTINEWKKTSVNLHKRPTMFIIDK